MTQQKLAKIYAQTIDGKIYEDDEPKRTMSFYYLDGQAEDINGYDICAGNLTAFSYAQSQTVFDALLVFADGKEEPCKVSSFFDTDWDHMRGYIWLYSDESVRPFINKAIENSGSLSTFYYIDDETGKIHFKHDKKDSVNK